MSSPTKETAKVEPVPVQQAEIGDINGGEYMIHVYVEETRGLKHPINEDETVDPIIMVTAFGKKRHSKPKKRVGTGATFWGEHFFFEKNFPTKYEVEAQRIIISVLDHNALGSDAVIGSVELSLSAVYMKDKHCILYQWAALSGLTKSFQKVLGFLKFSIGVFAQGDKQVHLDQEKVLDAKTNQKSLQVLYPPQITTQPYQLIIKVFRGEQLKKMDTFGQTDPYVKVEYGATPIESSVRKVTLEPIWNEDLLLPLSLPTINNRVIIKLIDWEQVQAHEILGSTIFHLEDIKEGKYKAPFWANIYGSHTGAKADWAATMNSVPETATEWKGRVQLALRLEDNPHPEFKTGPTKDTKTVELANKIVRENFELRAEIHVAFNLPKKGVKYHVKVRWGKSEVTTKKKETKDDRLIEIYESLALSEQFPIGSLGREEIPDIFVYLNDGDKDFSYVRYKYSDLSDAAVKAKSVFFQNDKSMTNKRDDLAGIVKMRVYAGKVGENKQVLAQYSWDKQVEKRQAQTAWRVHLNVYQAKHIISGDITGSSDPYLSVYFGGYENKTSVIENTTNPIWNERLEFSAQFNTIEEAAPFMLTLWDEDKGAINDDFLGSAIINIEQSCLNPEELPKPKWIKFRYGKDGTDAGELLVSLCCYNQANLIPRSPYIEPDAQTYFINMKILGLRNLESAGILPVKKAFVRFDIDSLKRRQEKSALAEKKALRTEPLDSGSNPNILTVINIDANLPIDPDFCPSMTCSVFDYIFKGASQPLIGNFAIPIGDYIKSTKDELEKRIEILSAYYRAKQAEKAKSGKIISKKDRSISMPKTDEEVELLVDNEGEPEEAGDASPKKTVDELLASQDAVERAKASRQFLIIPQLDNQGLEIDPPNPEKYLTLGHNKKDQTKQKHYRYLLQQELEKSGLIDASPFAKIPIYRGKTASEDNFFKKIFGVTESHKTVGYFKAMINVMSENEKVRFDSKIAAVSQFGSAKRFSFSDDEFLRKRDVIVRLYVIDAEGLPDRDDDSNSDPYLIVKLGNTVFNESKNYQLDCADPKFYKCYEFSTSLPGASELKISVWDHDDLDADDLIGETAIDLEDRWYSTTWRSLKYIPVETRELFDPTSTVPKGKIRLWLEILPRDQKKPAVWELAPKPPEEFELRVVVWECKNVPKVDIEDAVDIYITATLEDGQEQRTDTHFRSLNGKGSFNWRMVFPLQLPMRKHRISFKIWDKDLLTKNDYISEASFDFDSFADLAFENEQSVNVVKDKEKDNKFWLQCSTTDVVDGKNVTTNKGEILVSMMLVPKRQATLSPSGQGRANPNQNPYLPPPVGRLQLSWNPIKMIEQFLGPVARRTVCIVVCAICAIFIGIMTIPTFLASELSYAI